MKPTIVTIGVYGFDEQSFFQALQDAQIDTLCDIRARRGVRGSDNETNALSPATARSRRVAPATG